jgi:glutamate carboxypeptidase
MIDLLGELVSIESPSDDRPSLDRFAARLESLFGELGDLERIDPDDPQRGRHLRLTLNAQNGAEQHAVALCHYDTVWSLGTLQRIPFSVDAEGVARGPGCFDMKGGIVVLYFALQALRARGLRPARKLRVLFTSDEEVGSPTSRPLIEQTAEGAAVAYVLESPLPGGTLKTARKGTGDFIVSITGRAAHAGVEPQRGISATGELAHQVLALHALNDYAVGTTVNVGVVHGGTRPNVVAAEAEAHVDIRVETLAEAERIEAAIRGLQPHLPGAVLEIEGGLNRPPMERSAAIGALFEKARRNATAMGVDLREGSTGGGSDGNFTAAMGVPTLDGLGPEGEGAHAAHEHVDTESFPRRVALLAGLLIDR